MAKDWYLSAREFAVMRNHTQVSLEVNDIKGLERVLSKWQEFETSLLLALDIEWQDHEANPEDWNVKYNEAEFVIHWQRQLRLVRLLINEIQNTMYERIVG